MAKRHMAVAATAVTLWWLTAVTAVAATPAYGPVATRRRHSHIHFHPSSYYFWHSGSHGGGSLVLGLLCPIVIVAVVIWLVVRAIRRR